MSQMLNFIVFLLVSFNISYAQMGPMGPMGPIGPMGPQGPMGGPMGPQGPMMVPPGPFRLNQKQTQVGQNFAIGLPFLGTIGLSSNFGFGISNFLGGKK